MSFRDMTHGAECATSGNVEENDKAWSLLYKAAINGITSPLTFQLLYPPTFWNWPPCPKWPDCPESPRGKTPAAQYDFCAAMASWSAVGLFDAGALRFNDAYGHFLTIFAVTANDPGVQKKIDNKQQTVRDSWISRERIRRQAQLSYRKTTHGSNKPSFEVWLYSKEGARWLPLLRTKWEQYQTSVTELNGLISRTDAPSLKKAIQSYHNMEAYTELTPERVGFRPVPAWSTSESAVGWVREVEAGGGSRAKLKIRNIDQAYDYSGTWAGASTSIPSAFWSVAVNDRWEPVPAFETDTSLTAEIELRACSLISVQPGFWFNTAFPKFFKKGPFIAGFSGYPSDGDVYLWGKGGALNLVKTGMYVGYQPSFSISVSAAVFDSFFDKWTAATGFRIGPLQLGDLSGEETKKWERSARDLTFCGHSESKLPQIFGVNVNTLNVTP